MVSKLVSKHLMVPRYDGWSFCSLAIICHSFVTISKNSHSHYKDPWSILLYSNISIYLLALQNSTITLLYSWHFLTFHVWLATRGTAPPHVSSSAPRCQSWHPPNWWPTVLNAKQWISKYQENIRRISHKIYLIFQINIDQRCKRTPPYGSASSQTKSCGLRSKARAKHSSCRSPEDNIFRHRIMVYSFFERTPLMLGVWCLQLEHLRVLSI